MKAWRQQCEALGVCKDGQERVGERTFEGWYAATDNRPSALAWLAGRLRNYLLDESTQAVQTALYAAADRAVRQYAAVALEKAGLIAEAQKIRGLHPSSTRTAQERRQGRRGRRSAVSRARH